MRWLTGTGRVPAECLEKESECSMFMLSPGMQWIYELLAFLVGLYFPVTLLTWLVIDKFFTSGGEANALRRRHVQGHAKRVLTGRARPDA
jgi:hypothetical protein